MTKPATSAPARASIERALFAIGLLCCLLGLLGLLRWGPSDPLREVRVDAKFEGLNASDLWPHIQELMGQDLLALDLPALAQRLEQQPWIEEVRLRRAWPDRLLIDVTEASAFARWQGLQGEQGFVTASGLALEARHEPIQGLLYQGAAEYAPEFLRWKQQLESAVSDENWQLSRIRRSEYGQWRLWLQSSGKELELRFAEHWNLQAWQRFSAAWAAGLKQRAEEIAYIDLRYHGGLAVGWMQQLSQMNDQVNTTEFDSTMWAQAPQGV